MNNFQYLRRRKIFLKMKKKNRRRLLAKIGQYSIDIFISDTCAYPSKSKYSLNTKTVRTALAYVTLHVGMWEKAF